MIKIKMNETLGADLKMRGTVNDVCMEWGWVAVEIMKRMIGSGKTKEEAFTFLDEVLSVSKRTVEKSIELESVKGDVLKVLEKIFGDVKKQ